MSKMRDSRIRLSDRPIVVRLAFAAVLIAIPAELVIQSASSEPFPALTQPAFAYSARPLSGPTTVPVFSSSISATFQDGSTATFRSEEVVGWSAGIPVATILREAFFDRDPVPTASVEWLAGRVALLRPGSAPTTITVELVTVRIDASTSEEVSRSGAKVVTFAVASE